MIHLERVRLPAGTRAFAHREDGAIVVYVSAELPARERLAAIRQALRAAPAAGWRSSHSPVLLPALILGAGLRRAPEGRWTYRLAVTAAVVVAVLIAATTLTSVSLQHGPAGPPAALQPGQPLPAGPGPAPSRSAAGHGPGTGRQPGGRTGSSPGPRGSAPGSVPKPGKTTTTSPGGPAPAPQSSGTPAPVPTSSPSPQPSQTPAPSPSPSPAKPPGGSGSCVDVLGVTICL